MNATIPVVGGPHDGGQFKVDHRVEIGDAIYINAERYLFVMTNGSPRLVWQTWRDRG